MPIVDLYMDKPSVSPKSAPTGTSVRRILVWGSMPPCRLRRPEAKKILLPPPRSENCFFCMFSLFNFSSIFQGGSADPICPCVRTPMPTGPHLMHGSLDPPESISQTASRSVHRFCTADDCVLHRPTYAPRIS